MFREDVGILPVRSLLDESAFELVPDALRNRRGLGVIDQVQIGGKGFGCSEPVHEVKVPELDTSVFIIPGERVKNGDERLVVLNRVAKSVVESQRGKHPTHVFVHAPKDGEARPVTKTNNTGWKSARERAADKWEEEHDELAPEGFRRVRVHDLKHTFGRRLRAAGVSFEDRQDLLGHRSGRITTHYSQAELTNLIAAAEKVCGDENSRKPPATTWLHRRVSAVSL